MNLYFHTSLSSIYITYQVEVSRDLKIFKKFFLKNFFISPKCIKKEQPQQPLFPLRLFSKLCSNFLISSKLSNKLFNSTTS